MTTQAQRASQITLFSPAKINLYLRITGKRPDGYHELETVMLPLNFGDSITLQLRKTSLTLDCDNEQLPTDDSNIALRAAQLLTETIGNGKGAKITLRKRIPLAAGLGGGSSNAATVLTGLNHLWQAGVSREGLDRIAANLGSDVNFFLAGSAALCRGRGEQVEPTVCKLSASILLINPGFGISTKWAYGAWAKAARLTASAPDVSLLLRALAEDDLAGLCRGLYNSLEAPSVGKFPVLHLLKDTMLANGAAGALMSGSGATVFGLFADTGKAEEVARLVRERFGPSMWTQLCKCASARCPST